MKERERKRVREREREKERERDKAEICQHEYWKSLKFCQELNLKYMYSKVYTI